MIMPLMTGGYTCKQIAERASGYLDGDLGALEWARFRVHTMACSICNEYVRQIGITVHLLESLPPTETEQMRSELMGLYADWSDNHCTNAHGNDGGS